MPMLAKFNRRQKTAQLIRVLGIQGSMQKVIVNAAQEAWKSTENELNFKGYFATPISQYGYKLNQNEIGKLNLALLKIAFVFMMLGFTGFYVFSKSYPLVSQAITIAIFYAAPFVFNVQKNAIVKNKKFIQLPRNLFIVYCKYLSKMLSTSFIGKSLSLALVCSAGFTLAFTVVLDRGYSLFAYLILLPFILFLVLWGVMQIYLIWLKYNNA
jgi:ribosomal protein L30E